MNYWETVAGQELLNLIKMEVSRYSARKQYTIKTKAAKFERKHWKRNWQKGLNMFRLTSIS